MTPSLSEPSDRVRHLIAVGEGLPRMSFPQVAATGTVSWNQGTLATVVFVPHRGPCSECARYAAELGAAVVGLREWGTRAVVLVAPGSEMAAPGGVLLLADQGGEGRARLGVPPDQAAVVQADRWGAVYEVAEAVDGPHNALPTPSELVALAKFIDIQCPECAVPSKEWLASTPYPLG